MLAITGASAALALSSIPFEQTIAGVRVGLVDGAYVINPTYPERKTSKIDLVVAGSADAIMMVEAGAQGSDRGGDGRRARRRARARSSRSSRRSTTSSASAASRRRPSRPRRSTPTFVARGRGAGLRAARRGDAHQGQARELRHGRSGRSPSSSPSIPEDRAEQRADAKTIFKDLKEKVMRDEILERGQRLDGRRFDEIRPIWIETGVLPRVHGSAVFTRGETQALVSATLGTEDDAQKIETVEGETYKRFMLHYNFPPFSVGEVQFLRGPGRREVGHGALAERALAAARSRPKTEFPYTLRVVSDILESNGSSSMASVCGGALALMDAGVPLKAPVAGVAMGLVMNEKTGKWAVLTDIAGAEDHYGDMDFKVAGTRTGITALQMDIKVGGITMDIMRQALEQARKGRLEILDTMASALAGAARRTSPRFAPRIVTIRIPTEKIRDVIGPGGKTIRSIIEKTGVKIDVEDDGRVNVASADEAAAQEGDRR